MDPAVQFDQVTVPIWTPRAIIDPVTAAWRIVLKQFSFNVGFMFFFQDASFQKVHINNTDHVNFW